MRDRVSLLSDQRLLRKFCQRRNRDYRCAEIFGCQIACPLAHANETEYLMNLKNLALGEAYRMFERQPISEEEGKQIIREKLTEAEEWLRGVAERSAGWKENLFYKKEKDNVPRP